jgi:hypothetical protein
VLLRSLYISLHLCFCLLTYSVLTCFLSPLLAYNLSLAAMLCLFLM